MLRQALLLLMSRYATFITGLLYERCLRIRHRQFLKYDIRLGAIKLPIGRQPP